MTTNLSVHRNKVEQRRKRALASDLGKRVQNLVKEQDVRAYAVVAINSEGRGFAMWDTGAILPMWAFGDTVASILKKDIEDSGVREDWRPNLTLRGTING